MIFGRYLPGIDVKNLEFRPNGDAKGLVQLRYQARQAELQRETRNDVHLWISVAWHSWPMLAIPVRIQL